MQTQVPPEVFYGHLERIRQTWANKFDGQFDSIILVNGKTSGNEKSVAIVSWLFAAYNLTDTILSINLNEIIIFSSQRKITFLNTIKKHSNAEKYNLKFFPKEENNAAAFQKIWSSLHGAKANPKVGMLIKDAKIGAVAQEFQKFIQSKNYTPADASHFFNECFYKKDNQEIENIKKSSLISTYFLSKFIKEIEKTIDDGNSIKHSQLTKKVQDLLSHEGELKKCCVKVGANNQGLSISKQFIDVGPAINVQSGGDYSSTLFDQSNDENLKSDCIALGLGALYKSYNSYVARTIFIDPTEQQKSTYRKILTLCKIIQQNLKPGATLDQIYEKSVQFMKQHLSDVEIPTSFGFGIGVFLAQPLLQIAKDNKRAIQVGNTFVISCNFPNLKYETKKGVKKYCIKIVDTVAVTEKGQQILTSDASTSLSDMSYELGEDEEDQKKESKKNSVIIPTHSSGRPVTRAGPKQQQTMQKLTNQKKRAEHQMELKLKKIQELKQRVNENFIGGFKKQKNIECSKLQSYRSRDDLPKQMKKNQIYLDSKNNAILLPINGKHVPFNIHTLKSVVKNDEGKYSSLRFNFHLPGAIPNMTFPKFNEPCIYVKQMVFRSQQISRISELEKQIKQLQKKVKLDLNQKHAKQDIVEQEVIKQNKGKRPILRDLFARPGIGQKKVKGTLQCHLNGFKYKSIKGQVIDVSFSNIKFAFFQPCEKEIIAAIHFRLHQPILIGKKKSEDVQFYSEGGPNAEDVGGRNRGGYGGQDEDDEERQKQARRKLDKQFKAFMKSCEQFIGNKFEFEIPDREGGFYGNPFNNNSLLQPTKNCLINVVQNRFFIAVIEEIEIACFERMYANVKSFDMILVMKDYENFLKISSIPIKDVQKVKDWLDTCNIIFYDQGKTLNWIKFLGSIRKDFKKFVDDGAWMAWDQADQQQEENEQDEDQSFSISQSEEQEDSDDSESESDYADEQESSGSEDEDLSEQGLSSEELDERAEMQDRERDRRQMQRQKQRQKEKIMSKPQGKKK